MIAARSSASAGSGARLEVVRFFTVPDGRAARTSVGWALGLIGAEDHDRVYVPFGGDWFRYWMRRLAESRGT